ncbi:MAG: hypothetical protein WCE62_17615, partial [Polyangiales bacterium]
KTAPQNGAAIATGAGNEIRAPDFNLGNASLASNTIREIQRHQPHRVPWRCAPSRGVPWKVEGWVEGRLDWTMQPGLDGSIGHSMVWITGAAALPA